MDGQESRNPNIQETTPLVPVAGNQEIKPSEPPKEGDVPGIKNSPLEDKVKDLHTILVAIVIVLVMGFIQTAATVAGLVIDAYRFKASTYQSLIDKVEGQNQEIRDFMTNQKTTPQAAQPIIIYAQPGGQIQSATGSSN